MEFYLKTGQDLTSTVLYVPYSLGSGPLNLAGWSLCAQPLLDPPPPHREPGSLKTIHGYLAYKKPSPVGPYSRTMPRLLWWSYRGGRFLTSEVPLHPSCRMSGLCVRAEAQTLPTLLLLLLLYHSQAQSWVIQTSMRLEYEPASEPLHISVK